MTSYSVEHPFLVLIISFLCLWGATLFGGVLRRRFPLDDKDGQADIGILLTAVLTLLALIIGFTFSMAVTRYDVRINYEEAEANAIGTEYERLTLLSPDDATQLRVLLKEYLNQRILFYTVRNPSELDRVNSDTGALELKMWAAVSSPVVRGPTPTAALVASGMNDVLNSEGYTHAAWLNRIPGEAWILMLFMAACGSLLVGYSLHRRKGDLLLFSILPIVLSLAFFLIADIDSPRRGVIRLRPQNLSILAHSLQ